MTLVLCCLAAYFIGSIPFGLWIGLSRGKDLRKEGSGNIGATNVFRILGWKWGVVVFLLDVCKALGPALFARHFIEQPLLPTERALLVGMSAVVGHTFSPFLKFRGGKGVAAALGAVFGTTPMSATVAFGIWVVLFGFTGYVSLASILATISSAIVAGFMHEPILITVTYSVLALFILVKHIPNIKRLMRGEEHRFFRKESGESRSNKAD